MTSSDNTDQASSHQAKIWFNAVFLLEGILILVCSAFTIAVFWRRRLALKRASYLLINLAVADLLVGVGVAMLGSYILLRYKNPQFDIDVTLSCFICLSVTASIGSLVVIAVERALAMAKPFKHRAASTSYYYRAIGSVRAVGISVAVFSRLGVTGFYYTRFVVGSIIIICLIAMFLSYFTVWWFSSKRLSIKHASSHDKNRKLAATLSIVTFLSLATWLPSQVQIFRESEPLIIHSEPLYPFLVFKYGNSLVNPFVYALRMPEFRREINRLAAWRCCQVKKK